MAHGVYDNEPTPKPGSSDVTRQVRQKEHAKVPKIVVNDKGKPGVFDDK